MISVLLTQSPFNVSQELSFAQVLRDLQRFGYLHIADLDIAELVRAIESPHLRLVVRKTVEHLAKSGRVVRCKDLKIEDCSTYRPCCGEFSVTDFYVGITSALAGSTPQIDLNAYLGSSACIALQRCDFSYNEIAPLEDWEARVLGPLFRFARQVTFVDHILGDAWSTGSFKGSFEWIVSCLRRHGRRVEKVRLFTRVSRKTDFDALERDLARMNIELVNKTYMPGSDLSLPHDRYILADSLGLTVGQGLDLKFGERARSSYVGVVEDVGGVLNKCYRARPISFA